MTARELDAAGVREPAVRAAYERCRQLNAASGKTYFLATRLLTPRRRPAVHALYGFARWADDIVDDPLPPLSAAERTARLTQLDRDLQAGLRTGRSAHPVIAALADTVARYSLSPRLFGDFMRSMRMDLHVTEYATFEDLRGYMHGSAAVIGLQVLPVLGTVTPAAEAEPHAASLGLAFQMTNFLRDVGEDLDRDRVYLPQDLLASHGVDRDLLRWCRLHRRGEARVRAALRDFDAATRRVYRHAALGVPMLHPVSRPCVESALVLYRAILDEIGKADWDVVHRRTVVPPARRAALVAPALARLLAVRARHALPPHRPVQPWDVRPGGAGQAAGHEGTPAPGADGRPRTGRSRPAPGGPGTARAADPAPRTER